MTCNNVTARACTGFLKGVGEENAASEASSKQRAAAGSRDAAKPISIQIS